MDPMSRRRCPAEYYDGTLQQCRLPLGHEGEHTFREPEPLRTSETLVVIDRALKATPLLEFDEMKEIAATVYREHFVQPKRSWRHFCVFIAVLLRMVAIETPKHAKHPN